MLDQISATTQSTITRTRADEWVAIDAAVEVCDALVSALGRKPAVEFWSNVVYDSWVGGLLEPLVTSMSQPGGLGLLDLAPAAWSLSARECGEVVLVHDDAGRIRLEARGLPPLVRDSVGIQVMYAGALEAMLAFSKIAAKIEIVTGVDTLAFRLRKA